MIQSFHDLSNLTFNNITDQHLFERCNKSHFTNIDDNTYKYNKLNWALCMPLDY